MRHDDLADPPSRGGLDEPEDLVAAQMARAEDEPVAGDDVEHLVGLGEQRASIVDHRHRLAREAGLAKGQLERGPDRHLLVRGRPRGPRAAR